MKTQLLRVLFAGYLLCLFNTAMGQEVQFTAANQFYYNSYDDGNIGSVGYIQGVANKTIELTSTTNTTFNNTIALTSIDGVNQKNNIYGSIIGPTLDRNFNNYDYEWTFLYKNNSSISPVEPYDNSLSAGPTNGNGAWQYWLNASTYDQTSQTIQGFYMTQVGSNMILRYRANQNDIRSLISFPITNNVVWTIKVQRLNTGKWSVWANPVSGSNTEATTYINTQTLNSNNTYAYTIFATTDLRPTGNNFYWDNVKLYTRRMSVTSVSSTTNGITQPSFYAGQTNVVTSGIQINTRGTYTFADINFGITPSGGTNINAFFTNGRLYKSIDDTYTTTSDNSLLATVNINSPTMQSASINSGSGDPNYSSGNADGSLTRVADYFLVVDVLSSLNYGNPPPYNTYTQTGAVQIRTTDYTNPTYNGYTNNSTSGNNIVSFTNVAPPSASAVSRCGAGPIAISATGGSPTGGTYSWYTTATGGTAVATGATYTPTIVTTKTFYVTYTSGGSESPRTAVTATIYPVVSSPLSNAAISYSFSGNTKDVSGNQNDGVLENAPTLTTDRYGFANSAYSFNGSTQWMSSTTQIAGPSTFTMSLWFKTTTTTGGKLMSFSDGQNVSASGGYDRHLYMTNSGQLIFGVYNGATRTITSSSSYNDGNWHHAVVTVGTTSGIVMYVDNSSVGSLAYYAPETRNGYWKIGFDDLGGSWPSVPTSKYFNGSIDDVAIYNTELTSSAVSALNDVNQIGTYTSVCAGNPINIYAPTITGATYSWTSPGGTTYSGNPGVFASAVAGNYFLTVTGGPGGCSSTATYAPTVTSLPASTFTATSPVTVVTGTSTVALTSTYDATATYTWSFDSGIATGSTQTSYSVSWLTSGTKTISLTVTKGSCSSTTTQTVVVGLSGPTVPGTTLCGANSTTLTVTGAIAGVTYNWYINNTTTTALQSSTSASYTPFVGGTTTFYVSATSGTTTTLRTPVTVTVNQKAGSSINSPMLSYPFESGSLTDWSGLSNNGTLQGTTLPTTIADRNGLANGAYSFNGTNASPQYISTTTQYVPLIFSYSVWFKTTVAGGKLIGIGGNQTGSNATQDRNLYMNDAGQLYYGVYNGGTVTINTTKAYNDGLWHHVIVTDGPTNGMRIYVDGSQQASTTTYTIPQQINEYWRIGGDNLQGWPSRPSNDYFVGILDDVAIYNHELSATEAASNDMNLYKFSAGYCANNPLTITAQTITGATYSWVDNANTSITGSGNPVTFSKATTTNYTLTTTVNGCSQNTAIVTPTLQTYTWTGLAGTTAVGTDNNWTNTSTGIAGQAPKLDGTEAIVIGTASTGFYPLLTANKSAYTLTINSGAKLDLGGFTLNVGCNIFNSAGGTLTMGTGANFNTSAITWNGVSPNTNQSFTGSSTANSSQLGNMTVSNTVTGGNITLTSGKLDIYNVVTLTSGKLIVSSPATFTLKSLATQSATVAAIPSGLSITGNVSVERYIAGGASKRGYRLMTSPVNNGSGFFSINYIKNSAYVTGTTTTSGGFDLSPNANNPSIYFFRENTAISNTAFTSGNYRGVNNINNDPTYSFDGEALTYKIPVGNAFLFFFRGDRSVAPIATETVPSYVPTGTTFTATGTLNTGNITVKNWYDQTQSLLFSSTGGSAIQGYNLIGNPYASTINIEKFNRQATIAASSIYGAGFPSQVIPTTGTLSSPLKIWVFNPTTKQYDAYEQNRNPNADTTIVNSSAVRTGSASNMIASGQGFFIRATATGQSLTFRESAKSNVQPTNATLAAILSVPDKPGVMSLSAATARLASQQAPSATVDLPESVLKFRLVKDTVNTDDIVIALDKGINTVFNKDKDAEDLGGSGALVSLSALSSDSIKTSIHRRPYPNKLQQVIPIVADATTSGQYQLNLTNSINLPAVYEVWLKDAMTKDSLDIKNTPTYNFAIDKSNTSSFGGKRFQIIIRENPALMLRLLDFTATKVATGAKSEWKVANEDNYTLFTVQRSTDNGKTWQDLTVMQSNNTTLYNYIDPNPAIGINKYRLQLTDLNNDISFSKELPLMYANTQNNIANKLITIYPNPVKETLNLTIAQTNASSNYNIQLINSSGILLKNVNITELYWKNNVSSFVPGTYVLKVIDNKTKTLIGTIKVLKL